MFVGFALVIKAQGTLVHPIGLHPVAPPKPRGVVWVKQYSTAGSSKAAGHGGVKGDGGMERWREGRMERRRRTLAQEHFCSLAEQKAAQLH